MTVPVIITIIYGLLFVDALGVMFGFIYLIDRKSKTQARTGKHQEKIEIPEIAGPVARKGWSKKKTGIGCGIVIIMLICTVAGYFAYTSRDAKTLGIEVNYPKTVHVGDSFELTVYLKNKGEKEFEVQTIDLSPPVNGDDDSILAGTSVTGTEPVMNSTWVSYTKTRAYQYFQVVKPGETQKATFYFQGVQTGRFDTDVDVYLSDSWSTASDILISIDP